MLESSRHAGRGLEEYSRTHCTVNDASMSIPAKLIDRGLVNPGVVEYPPGCELLQVMDGSIGDIPGTVLGSLWVWNQCVVTKHNR
jgi:hypothetical protein